MTVSAAFTLRPLSLADACAVAIVYRAQQDRRYEAYRHKPVAHNLSEAAHARARACRAPAGRVLAVSSLSPRPCVASRCVLLQKTITQIHLPRGIILLPGGSLRHDHIISRSSPLPRREVTNQVHSSHISLTHQCTPMPWVRTIARNPSQHSTIFGRAIQSDARGKVTVLSRSTIGGLPFT